LARAMGIDPGTKSFDVVVVDGDRVVFEKSIATEVVASNPTTLVEAVEEAGSVDLIAGPSGYGTPVVCNDEILDPELFAREVLLLTSLEDLAEGLARGEAGIAVYKALVDVVRELWLRKLPVCYFPSIILLPSIPRFRKINKIDMGTVDKLAVTLLAIHDHSREYGVDYSEASFVLVEMGFGYNAVIGVESGRVVDAYGGTLVPMGFLTAGPLDAEVVVAGRVWKRSDVFHGGVSDLCKTLDFEEALKARSVSELCSDGFEAMFESLYKAVLAVASSLKKPREIVVSGRLARHPAVFEEVASRFERILPVRRLRGLRGAKLSKEAGQGYAIMAEGFAGGFFRDLVDRVGVREARGTVLDWVYHPRLAGVRERLVEAYKKALVESSWKRVLGWGL